jgi:WD40 repeat protein
VNIVVTRRLYYFSNTAPVWQVAWAHPKFGTILASCAYDGRVLIFKEQNGSWTKIHENNKHTASGKIPKYFFFLLGPVINEVL